MENVQFDQFLNIDLSKRDERSVKYILNSLKTAKYFQLPDYGLDQTIQKYGSLFSLYGSEVPEIVLPSNMITLNYDYIMESKEDGRVPMTLLCKQVEGGIAFFIFAKVGSLRSLTKTATVIKSKWRGDQIEIIKAESNIGQERSDFVSLLINYAIEVILAFVAKSNQEAQDNVIQMRPS